MEYYDKVNDGNYYLCDRCNVVKLRHDEYENNKVVIVIENGINMDYRYCDECHNYIYLKKWMCNICSGTGTLRSERTIYKEHCGNEVIWYQ